MENAKERWKRERERKKESSNRNIADVRGKPKKTKKGGREGDSERERERGSKEIRWMLSVLHKDEGSVDEKAGRTVLCLFPPKQRGKEREKERKKERKGAERRREKKKILKVREMLLWCRRLLLEAKRLLQRDLPCYSFGSKGVEATAVVLAAACGRILCGVRYAAKTFCVYGMCVCEETDMHGR